jgi:hypothetical protein
MTESHPLSPNKNALSNGVTHSNHKASRVPAHGLRCLFSAALHMDLEQTHQGRCMPTARSGWLLPCVPQAGPAERERLRSHCELGKAFHK